MTKIYCASINCKSNKNRICAAKQINLIEENVNTLYQGRRNFNTCKNYEESEEYKELKDKLKLLIDKQGK